MGLSTTEQPEGQATTLPPVRETGESAMDLLGFGVAAVDELIELDRMPETDVKVDVRGHDTQVGGLCVNALAAAAKLGLRCHYVGPLGRDRLSGIVRCGLDAAGITYPGQIRDPEAGPCHAFVIIDRSSGTRTILMNKARVRAMTPDELPDALLERTRALYVDAWRLEVGISAVRRAQALGVTVFADFEEDDPGRVRPLLPFIDHLILPLAYARTLTGRTEADEVVGALEPARRACTAVTWGEAGCVYATADAPHDVRHQPAYRVPVVDTTGCGDAFHGAYIAAVLGGQSAPEALRYATAAAALCAGAVGAQAGLASHDEICALVAGDLDPAVTRLG